MGGGVMADQMGFEEVELTSRADCLPGSTAVKAIVDDELNEWAKREAKRRGLTAAQFLGQLLEPALIAAQNSAKVKQIEQLQALFGDNWRDQLKNLV